MQDYDKTKQHLDDNNLCGCAMRPQLPVSDFKWSEDKIDDILVTTEESEKGYIVEVDLEYPSELHDLHNDYPLAPET